jgi:hypothetical protein
MFWSYIYISYQYLDLYRIPKPRFIQYTNTYIYIVYQKLDLYRIPKARFISHAKVLVYGINLGFGKRDKSRFYYAT